MNKIQPWYDAEPLRLQARTILHSRAAASSPPSRWTSMMFVVTVCVFLPGPGFASCSSLAACLAASEAAVLSLRAFDFSNLDTDRLYVSP